MANEIRLRRNNMMGTITDNPLSNVATTINSAGFVDLPVVDTTNHLILILDPTEANGPAEIVRVTAHTAASSVVTVTRGAEGSAARSHILGTTWFFGPVTSDYEEILTSSTRPIVPYTGETIFETDTARSMRYSGTAWIQDGLNWDPPHCAVRNSANQTHSNNGAWQAITFDTEDEDNDSMHSTTVNTSRITINTAGLYLITGGMVIGTSGTGIRALGLRKNSSGTNAPNIKGRDQASIVGATDHGMNLAAPVKLSVADYVELVVFQNSGGNQTMSAFTAEHLPYFTATWIGRGN